MKCVAAIVLWGTFLIAMFGYALGGLIAFQLIQQGKPAAAIGIYKAALWIYPWNAPNRNDLGLTLLESGDVDGAIVELREAVALAAWVPKYHNHLGVALLRKGDLVGAIDQFRQAIRLDPHWQEPARNLERAISQGQNKA